VINQSEVPAQMLGRRPYALGVPLTDAMDLVGREGIHWLVYIEAIPLPPARFWSRGTGFPGRRLRFDSAADSRVVSSVPAGSPFLADSRLQDLLDRSSSLNTVLAVAPVTVPAAPWRWSVEVVRLLAWITRLAGGLGGGLATRSRRGTG
jgi:hypothetical protein